MQEFKVLGVKINCLPEHLAKELLFDFLNSAGQHQIATVNPEFILEAQKNKNFKNTLNETSLSTIDGTGIVWALQLAGHKVSLADRITGVRLTQMLIQIAEIKEHRILFCIRPDGLTSPEKISTFLKTKYPKLKFQISNSSEALFQAQTWQPAILLVALGAPVQEQWIADNLNSMPSVKIAVGIGGALDFLSGTFKKAPKIFSSFGLEWLWRLIKQPIDKGFSKRIKRIFKAVIVFPFFVIKDKIK
jgi:N-acetylglucosaminyldiphosphoundecaprenol N-acetyl-beta-D-mannosaminyltransferase